MSGIDYFAWFVFLTIIVSAVFVFVSLAQLPGKFARERNHPQADASNIASWLEMRKRFRETSGTKAYAARHQRGIYKTIKNTGLMWWF